MMQVCSQHPDVQTYYIIADGLCNNEILFCIQKRSNLSFPYSFSSLGFQNAFFTVMFIGTQMGLFHSWTVNFVSGLILVSVSKVCDFIGNLTPYT